MKVLQVPFYICYCILWYLTQVIANTGVLIMKFTKVDRSKELEGSWLDYDDGAGGTIKLLVARTEGNPHYDSLLTKKMQPHRKKMEKGKSISNDVAKRIMNEVYSKEILLDWEKEVLFDDEGKEISYSSEAAVELLSDDHDLRDAVIEFSGDQSNFLMSKK